MRAASSAIVLAAVAAVTVGATGCGPAAAPPKSTIGVFSGDGRVQQGKASWYGREQHGGPTASGERYDMNAMTAAHRTLRMNTRVRVTNLKNGKQVVLRINDRGPYGKGRVIDVSRAAAVQLDMLDSGVVPCRVEVLE